jgi:sigma-E factor negative regulatory protein RseB
VLRREVYDQQGRTTRASSFVEVSVGTVTGAAHLPPPMPDAWSHEVGSADRAQMRARGWHCPDRLAGDLELVDARRGGGPERPILHLSYTDGLATVSLFEQRGRLDEENLEGYRRSERDGRVVHVRDGVPTRVVWSAEGTVYTLVADAPPATVEQVVDGLPHEPVEKGGWHRVGRGLDRVASWFNPFG